MDNEMRDLNYLLFSSGTSISFFFPLLSLDSLGSTPSSPEDSTSLFSGLVSFAFFSSSLIAS